MASEEEEKALIEQLQKEFPDMDLTDEDNVAALQELITSTATDVEE